MKKNITSESWDMVIEPKAKSLYIPWKDLWEFKDLLYMFVKRDVITVYKQTILGPVWYVLQPIMTTIIYMFVFGRIAGISTDGVPQVLFYLSGITIWNYFSECFNTTSKTFRENAGLFGKVYFPRLIMPLAKTLSSLLKFLIQFALLISVWVYMLWSGKVEFKANEGMLLIPVYLFIMAGLGLGLGIIFTSMTTKYRDLTFLIQFGVQLLMYASPVIYPISTVPAKYQTFLMFNPLSPVLEGLRHAFFGVGDADPTFLLYSIVFMLVTLLSGIVVFNRTERKFIDSI
ncbi:MAG: ABC transporter permease [Vicingaceae bacterium]